MSPSMRRFVIVAALAAPVLALGGVVGLELWRGAGVGAALTPSPGIGGPFQLASAEGPMSDADLKGKPFILFFGFTRCPDVCPTTVFEMSEWLTELDREGRRIEAVMVSVDPERDTPDSLRDYLSSFGGRIVGLTGTPEQIAAVAKAYRAFYAKSPTGAGDYTMDHQASVYLMNRRGEFVGTIAYQEKRDVALQKLRRLHAS